MGILTETTINYGEIFGPLPQNGTEVIRHISRLTLQPDFFTTNIKVNIIEAKLKDDRDWLIRVSAARNEEEQNMEAYIKNGSVFYRSLRMIRQDEELLVWYSKDLSLAIGVGDLSRQTSLENQSEWSCPFCGEPFLQPFPLKAHMRFSCPRNKTDGDTSTANDVNDTASSSNKRKHSDDVTTKNDNIFDNFPKKRKKSSTDAARANELHYKNEDVYVENSKPLDFNQNVNLDESPNVNSAFKKVLKPFLYGGDYDQEPNIMQSLAVKQFFSTNSLATAMSARSTQKYGFSIPAANVIGSIFPMLSTLGIHRFMQCISKDGNVLPEKLAAITQSADGVMAPRSQKTSTDFNSTSMVQMNFAKLRPPFDKSHFPFVRTANPMVDKLLHSLEPSVAHLPLSSLPMTQNWCAQCNATFRMTSDLVYHMRSHHQREFDPIKRKREDKLRCGVCQEGFRERHHLTRHMTSHL